MVLFGNHYFRNGSSESFFEIGNAWSVLNDFQTDMLTGVLHVPLVSDGSSTCLYIVAADH